MSSRLEMFCVGGDGGIRTLDLTDANRTLSQLSYVPNAADYKRCPARCQEKFLRPQSARVIIAEKIFKETHK